MNENIGLKIKVLRKQRNMTLQQVSEKCSLSISFLSQVERYKSSVTLTSLRKISEALNVDITYFFEDNLTSAHKKIKKSAKEATDFGTNFDFISLSGQIPNPVFEPLLITIYPKEENNVPYSHRGQEFIYILKGSLTVVLENSVFLLHAGDHLHINSSTPHTWYNNTKDIVKMLFILSKST